MIFAIRPSCVLALPPGAAAAALRHHPEYYNFLRELTEAADAGTIDLTVILDRSTKFPREHLRHLRRPAVLLIGDDPGPPAGQGGPPAWECATRIGQWCRGLIIHAAGGEPVTYARAVSAAIEMGSVALIETTTMNAQAWRDCVRCERTLLVRPRAGLCHPVADRVLH